MERFPYPGEAFFNVKMSHFRSDTFSDSLLAQNQAFSLVKYAVAGYVVIFPDTAS
jgi:hypothetical protein